MEITHKNQGELDSTMLPFVMRELVELAEAQEKFVWEIAGRTGHEEKGIAFRRCTVLYIFFQVV